MKKSINYILSFLIPILIFISVLFFNGFMSKYSILVSDMWVQYYGLFNKLKDIINGNSSLFYTYQIGLGQSFFSTFAYYLASPLNLLLLFFSNIENAMLYIIMLKIGLCGLTMFIYLKYHFKNQDYKLLLFSSSYALSLQIICNYFNIMWLDAYYLAPLVLLGIDKLLAENKSITYFISLFLLILTNYYMGYMTCIFCIIYFIYRMYVTYDFKNIKNNIFKFSIISILSGLFTMFINIPNLLEIISIQRTDNPELAVTGLFNFNILLNISKFFFMNHSFKIFFNKSFIYFYFGMFPLLNLILYFFNKNITKKEKKGLGFIIILLILSLLINPLNKIWHVFNSPLGFNYRYYFLFLIIFIYASCKNFVSLDNISLKKCISILLSFIIIGIICLVSNNLTLKSLILNIIIILIYLFIVKFYNKNSKLLVLLFILVFGELYFNTMNIFSNDTYLLSSYVTYRNDLKNNIVNNIKSNDKDKFYRIEFGGALDNDAMLYNYNSITSWYSTMDAKSIEFLSYFGYLVNLNQQKHVNLPVLDSILGIKYYVTNTITDLDEKSTDEEKDLLGKKNVQQNKYSLGLGYMINSKITDIITCENAYECQNVLATQLTGTDIKYYKEENIIKNDNKYTFTINNKNNFVIRFPYKYTSSDSFSYDVYINGSYMQTITQDTGFVSEFTNNAKIGTKIEISIENIEGDIKADEIFVYYKNEEELQKMYDILSKNQLDITSLKDGYIKGTVESTEDKNILFLSIPYEKGWNAKVDGKKVEINSLYDTFISLELSKGVHDVELYYTTPGLKLGILISSISLFGYFVYLYFEKKQNKKTIN